MAPEAKLGTALDPAWTLSYTGRPKPFFHPVRTPGGQLLSLQEPADHQGGARDHQDGGDDEPPRE